MKWTVAFVSAAALGFAAIHLAAQAPSSSAAGIDALFKDLKWRNIGPANMAGRVTDIEAVEANPAIVYVAAASGGVWKSVNAGTTWEPIFTNYQHVEHRRHRHLPEGSRTSSGSAPAKAACATAPRGATASTSPPTPARRSSTSA